MNLSDIHTPVLLDRCVELLGPALENTNPVLVDMTLGMGGHSEAFLARFPELTIVGIDRDPDALAIARKRLAEYSDRVHFVSAVYDQVPHVLDDIGIKDVDAVLCDLGVSSLQIDQAERGFSYARNAPLDMRMNPRESLTAESIIADYSETELRRIFMEYGEEKLSSRYARAIVEARQKAPIRTSAELVAIISDATPAALARSGHPAKRVFQALRIEVNAELDILKHAIPAVLKRIRVDGRIVVLAYQSLEDRIVKRVLAQESASTAPAGLPVELPEHQPQFRLLVRGAERASLDEQERNPRAIPVRLRAAERVRRAA